MCEYRGCEQQNYRSNGLQCCDNGPPPLGKLKPQCPQQYRCNNGQTKKPSTKEIENSKSSTRKSGSAQQKNSCTNKKANKKIKQSSGKSKSKAANDKEQKQNMECQESDLSCIESEPEEGFDSADETKESNSTEATQNESVLGIMQKAMDHTMRAYFMHTMEKIECLSAQLLRNEGLVTKMHLDFVEKLCCLSQRNLIQFQALIERLNYLFKDQQKESASQSKYYNSEEDENVLGNANVQGNASVQGNVNVPGNVNGDAKTFDIPERLSNEKSHRNRESLTNSNESHRYRKVPQLQASTSFYPIKERNSLNHTDGEEVEHAYENFLDEKSEFKCYCECQKKIKCLQKALNHSKIELDESVKRLEQIRERNTDRDMSTYSDQIDGNLPDVNIPSKSKSPVSDAQLEDFVEPKSKSNSKNHMSDAQLEDFVEPKSKSNSKNRMSDATLQDFVEQKLKSKKRMSDASLEDLVESQESKEKKKFCCCSKKN